MSERYEEPKTIDTHEWDPGPDGAGHIGGFLEICICRDCGGLVASTATHDTWHEGGGGG